MEEQQIISEIQQKLNTLEAEQHIRILHCVESGSRAWGFASPDSDYDVRFFYVREPDCYLRLDPMRDVIEYELNEIYDINGWDLQKTLRLLYRSNPTLFEWNNSPLVYRTTPEWELVRKVIDSYFVDKKGVYHYLSMAKTTYREYLRKDTVLLKKYFYAVRPLLACRWILEHHSPPPMLFTELMETQLPEHLRQTMESLLALKMQSPELGTGKRIDILNTYIEEEIDRLGKLVHKLPERHEGTVETLNALFLQILRS